MNKTNRTTDRRTVLKGALGAAATLAGTRLLLPGGAWAAPADAPETTKAVFGFIALMDAAPLIVAKDKGFFAKHGMPDVVVQKQASWGTTRDNLELGSAGGGIDGAHILSPMPYLMASGRITKNNAKLPMYLLARLNTDGQCISVANAYKDLKVTVEAKALKDAFAKARAAGKELKCANTFPGGTHDMWIRYWLAAAGIDPDKDVSTITVPPPQMVANMKVNTMEAFCVAEPWNLQLVHQNIGYTACITGELWSGHPEKALAMRADWVDKHPKAAKAVLMAVQEAAQWCEKNIEEMVRIVSGREWIKVPVEDVMDRAKGLFDYGDGRVVKDSPFVMKYWKNHASYPFQSHDLWFLVENQRWGYQPKDLDRQALVKQVNREDLWREAARALGVADADIPKSPSRGVETFFDGKTFDPANPEAYLASLAIKRI
ncbi:MAG: ABC transporter substrate-binding protein [Magnetospirillum sp. WYHS-4]